MNDTELKEELRRVVALLARGADALLTFREQKGIIRDTGGEGIVGLTSSHRTVTALAEAQRVLRDEGTPYSRTCSKLATALRDLWNEQYAPHIGVMGPDDCLAFALRNSADNRVNVFTDAHLTCALAYAGTPLLEVADETQLSHAKGLRRVLANDASARLAAHAIGKVSESDSGHDFVTLWAVRAVDVVAQRDDESPPTWGAKVGKRVRDNVLQQLGWHAAGVGARFDPGELAFGLPLLQRFSPDEARPLAARCIEVMGGAQTPDGAWPGSRIVSTGNGSLLHITSYEIALTLATWLDQRDSSVPTDDSSAAVSSMTLELLRRAFRLAETSYTDEEWESDGETGGGGVRRRGWSNDRTRGQGRVESWVTAIVVTFLARYYDVLCAQLQRQILSRYETSWPHLRIEPEVAQYAWPDLVRSFGSSEGFKPATESLAEQVSDPSDDGMISDSLAFNIVEPIFESANMRPREGSLSFVLPGPPGSRKTSLVAGVAAALQWPLVTVSPPTFLLEGLDGLERRAAAVFQDLTSLRRVVILFDECEELFRNRRSETTSLSGKAGSPDDHATSPATRTAGAFITTGMLPRLQALHDRAWSIFALAFNGGIEQLDEAAIRRGRFDYTLPLGYPTLKAQIRHVGRKLGTDATAKSLIAALQQRAKGAERSKADASLPWAALSDVLGLCLANPNATELELIDALQSFDEARPPSLPVRPAS